MVTLLISPVGYTVNYKTVNYILGEKSEKDWISSRALLKLKYEENWNNLYVLLIYPDNEGARKSMFEGWTEEDHKKNNNINIRPSVISIFEDFPSVGTIKVDDTKNIGENEISRLLNKIRNYITEILKKEEKVDIIFDLTHSYRHLSLAGFMQALFISDIIGDNVTLNDVYYAMAKQPLKENDEVYYLKLNSFIELTRDIGNITQSITELRPREIVDIGTKYSKRGEYLNKSYLNEMGDKTVDIGKLLQKLQMGLCHDDTLNDIKDMLEPINKEPEDGEFHAAIIYDSIIVSCRKLLKEFETEDGQWEPFVDRQMDLALHSLNKQNDLIKGYSYMREAIVSHIVSLIFNVDDGGDKTRREKAERVLSLLRKDAREKKLTGTVKDFVNNANKIADLRNLFAHVAAGRKTELTDINKQFKNATKDYNKLKTFLSEENKELKEICNKIYIETEKSDESGIVDQ